MDKEIEVPTFGFHNYNSNICYFNSLLQNIINCKYIMYYLINEQTPKNKLQKYFKSKFIKFTKLYNQESKEEFLKETSMFSWELLNILLEKHSNININEQQSSSEFFLYLIEELGIEHYFKIRHKINIHCGNCKNISSKIDECYHYEMFTSKENEDDTVDIDHFMYNVNVLKDYKCNKCNTVAQSLYEKQAVNISKYFVVILNKYYNKPLIEYPNSFEITVKKPNDTEHNTPLISVWNNIGQIEHIGHLESGHYIALCKRFNSLFLFDDTTVKMLEQNKMFATQNTYVIFYEKQ